MYIVLPDNPWLKKIKKANSVSFFTLWFIFAFFLKP
jgi:hypothetical protein